MRDPEMMKGIQEGQQDIKADRLCSKKKCLEKHRKDPKGLDALNKENLLALLPR